MKRKLSPLTLALVLFLLLPFFITNCSKDDAKPTAPRVTNGLYILNEGLFNQNNSTLTYYDFGTSTPTTDFFKQKNSRGLGDTGNDLEIYGSKVYTVMNGSSELEVFDLKTGQSLKQIPMFNDKSVPRSPRNIAFYKGYAYVSSYDGTVGRLDTSTLQFDKFVTVGRQPEGLCVANEKLYVANSGAFDSPDYDNTVSVVNISTFTEIKKITVAINLGGVAVDSYGDVYVISRGNYVNINSSLHVIDSKTDTEKKNVFDNLQVDKLAINGDLGYLYNYSFSTGESNIRVLDVKNETIPSDKFITDETKITTPYGIGVDSSNGDVYICDAYNFTITGDVFCFAKDGTFKFKFEAGLNPNTVVFIQK